MSCPSPVPEAVRRIASRHVEYRTGWLATVACAAAFHPRVRQRFRFAPGRGSIFKQTYWPLATPDAALLAKWAAIRQVREAVNKAIEDLRSGGGVGASLQATVTVTAPPETFIIDGQGRILYRHAGPLVREDYTNRFLPELEKARAAAE